MGERKNRELPVLFDGEPSALCSIGPTSGEGWSRLLHGNKCYCQPLSHCIWLLWNAEIPFQHYPSSQKRQMRGSQASERHTDTSPCKGYSRQDCWISLDTMNRQTDITPNSGGLTPSNAMYILLLLRTQKHFSSTNPKPMFYFELKIPQN